MKRYKLLPNVFTFECIIGVLGSMSIGSVIASDTIGFLIRIAESDHGDGLSR